MRTLAAMNPAARSSPSTLRNRDPILAVLRDRLPASGLVLEIASGAGEHAVWMAAALPHLRWQPTDYGDLTSIAAWRDEAGLDNLLEPIALDAGSPEAWAVSAADAIVCINMVHITRWRVTQGLMAGAARVLPSGGRLFLYGPYIEAGAPTAPSNLAFDLDLKRRDPSGGVRDLDAVGEPARGQGLALAERIAMPANNLILVFEKG